MATRHTSTHLSNARRGEAPTHSAPATPDHGENSSSTLIEAPQGAAARRRDPLQAHDFPDGGGSGGAEAFSRKRVGRPRSG